MNNTLEKTEVRQEFSVGVVVRTSSKDPQVVRELLEKFEKSIEGNLYADKNGSFQVEMVVPR